MNALMIKINNIELHDIVKNPSQYPEELVFAAFDLIIEMGRQVNDAKLRTSQYLKGKMISENATKFNFIGLDGREKLATLKSGTVECKRKDADIVYQKHGFRPEEIGEYKFCPIWSMAKEARKHGGEKQLIIDELFKSREPSIELKDIK